jgi:CheY-like chemotaxis protein
VKKVGPVIIIEDDDEIRESMRDALETEGYSVAVFRNGREAINGLQGHIKPCLILLDLMMPVMDGWEFMEAWKNLPGTYASTPVFIISAVADQQKVKAAGAAGYIKKPMDLDILLQMVRKHC